MNKDEFLKIQTCVLKVNIHCDGCKQKVKKILQKIDGVYTIKIDSEQGKVTVSGNVDPATLIKKLIKNGKHAQIWGASKPHNNFQNQLNNQFKNLQIDYGKGGNNKGNIIQKGGNDKPKGAGQDQLQLLQQLQQMKGFQDLKALPLNKDHNQKSAKLNLPKDEDLSDDEFDDVYDDDDDDDEYDDDDDDEFDDDDDVEDTPLNKAKPMGGKGHGGSYMSNLLMNSQNLVKGGGNNGGNGGGNAKKGSGGENGGGANGGKKDGNQSQGGGKGGKGGGAQPQDNKNGGGGGQNNKNGNHGGSGATNGKSFMPNGFMPNGAKKSGGMNDMTHGMPNMMSMNMPTGQMGNIPTRPIGNLPAFQGLPTLNATSGGRGYINGGGPEHVAGNPNYQQQLAAMMMNQQRANGHESFQPMMYSRPPPAVNYMPSYLPYPYPPPPGERIDQYSMFSDENTSGCSVM